MPLDKGLMESEDEISNCTTEVEEPEKLQLLLLVNGDDGESFVLINGEENEGDDVSVVGCLPSSIKGDSVEEDDTQRVLAIFESAVDEWYSKLAPLGPLGDKEILKASFQLARNFNLDITADTDWLKRFKSRHGLSISEEVLTNTVVQEPAVTDSDVQQTSVVEYSQRQSTVSDRDVQQPAITTCSDQQYEYQEDLVVVKQSDSDDESVSPSPPLKRGKIESATLGTVKNGELTVLNGSLANYCSDPADFSALIITLVDHHGKSPNEAINWVRDFMKTLFSWIVTESSSERLHLYQLRLKVANLAGEMGAPTFTFRDEFFINIFENLSHRFVKCNRRRTRESWTPFSDEVIKWYDENSLRRFVTAMELESKIVEIAEAMNLVRFSPSQESLQHLLDRYGLYCPINKKLSLFVKPSAGLLVHRFYAACVAWYQEWPAVIDDVFVDECDFSPLDWTLLRNYLAVLTEWFVGMPEPVSVNTMVQKEVQLAKEMRIGLDVYCDWYRKWCEKVTNTLQKIKTFNKNLVHQCVSVLPRPPHCFNEHNVRARCMKIKHTAEELAEEAGLRDFLVTKSWLKRFLWLNKLEKMVSACEIDDFFEKEMGSCHEIR